MINKIIGGEDMDKIYFVYKTTNLINNTIYIGVHETTNINDGYIGSGKLLKQAIKKYGKTNFKRDILEFCNSKHDAYEYEAKLVDSIFIKRDDVYNLTEGGRGVITHSSFGIERIRKCSIDKVVAKDNLLGTVVKISKSTFDANPDRYAGHTTGRRVMKTVTNETVVVDNKNDTSLVGITKGLTKVFNETGKIIMVSVTDEKFLSKQYTSTSAGRIVVKDINGNKFTVNKDDPRLISKEVVGIAAGKRYKQNKKRQQVTCPHCNKIGDSSNMKRWHFDNCKSIIKI
jgi:hypothetical protein